MNSECRRSITLCLIQAGTYIHTHVRVCKERPCGQIVPTICFYKVLLECSLVRQNNGPQKNLCPSSRNLWVYFFTWQHMTLHEYIALHAFADVIKVMDAEMGDYTEWQPVREIGQKEGESFAEGLSSLWVAVGREEEVINPEMQVTREAGNSSQLTARKWGTSVLQPQDTKFCQQPQLASR